MKFEGDCWQVAGQVRALQEALVLPDLENIVPDVGGGIPDGWMNLSFALHNLASGYAAMSERLWEMEIDRYGVALQRAIAADYRSENPGKITIAQMSNVSTAFVLGDWGVAADVIINAGNYPRAIVTAARLVLKACAKRDACRGLQFRFPDPAVGADEVE